MQHPVPIHRLRIGVGIAIQTAVAACIISPDIHTLHTSTLRPLVPVLGDLQPAPQQLFNQHTVDAPAMADAHRLQVYPFCTSLNPDVEK